MSLAQKIAADRIARRDLENEIVDLLRPLARDRGRVPAERWVLVAHGWFEGGLRAEHAEAAIAALSIPRAA